MVNHSTVAPPETIEASRIVEGRHAKYLDAPFTGSRDAAEAGQLVFYIGGGSEVLEKVRPLLEVNAKAILPIGEIGQAAALKIAMNLIAAIAGEFVCGGAMPAREERHPAAENRRGFSEPHRPLATRGSEGCRA